MNIHIANFREIVRVLNLKTREEEKELSYEYTWVLSDFQNDKDTFINLFEETKKAIIEYIMDAAIINCFNGLVNEICATLYSKHPLVEILYNKIYMSILIASIVIFDCKDYIKSNWGGVNE